MVANILPADSPQTLGVGSKGPFFRTWSCAYQVIGNGACKHPPPIDPRGQNVKIQLFQNMVMLHFLIAITNAATW